MNRVKNKQIALEKTLAMTNKFLYEPITNLALILLGIYYLKDIKQSLHNNLIKSLQMEDFFQIIIFIIFIISSIISSKNKKKKKQQKAKANTNFPKVSNTKEPQKSQQEIFEELLGLKPKPEVPPVGVITETSERKESVYKTWYAEDDFKKTKHNDNYSFKNKVQKNKEQLEKEKLAHKALTKLTKPSKVIKQNKYQKIFRNPSTLREYIIVSEVLNKPKALRR